MYIPQLMSLEMDKSILIIGGYGMAGRALSRAVLTNLDVHLIISGRDQQKLDTFSASLKSEFPNKEHLPIVMDATHRESLLNAMSKVEVAIVAATIPDHIELVAECAIETNTNLMDIFVRNDVLDRLEQFDPVLIEKELVHFTQCGFHPGIIAPLIKHLAPYFDVYESANVAMAMEPIFEKPDAVQELIFEMFETHPTILKDGVWHQSDYNHTIQAKFSPYFGTKTCYPLHMQEISHLNLSLGLKNAGVYAAGFSRLIDYGVFPTAMLIGKFNKKLAEKVGGWLMYKASRKFQKNELRVELILHATGLKKGIKKEVELRLIAHDGYVLTAIPLISLLNQYEGLTPKPIGLHLMGETLINQPLIEDLREAGISIDVKEIEAPKKSHMAEH